MTEPFTDDHWLIGANRPEETESPPEGRATKPPERESKGEASRGRSPSAQQAAEPPKSCAEGTLLSKVKAMTYSMQPVGIVRSPYSETAQIPKGCGARHDAEGVIEILPEFEQGLTDIEGFSHLFVIWVFHQADGYELLGTPPTDNRAHGVFATRSPRRPNPLGLTVVRLIRREGTRLIVAGVDMLDGTPILDIKPYLSSIPEGDLKRGWLAEAEERKRRMDLQSRT